MIFSLSWLILISFFRPNYVNLFLPTSNKCKIAIIILLMIKIKSFLKKSFMGFQLTCFRKQTYFSHLHTTTLMHYKARQVSRDLFSSNHGNDSDMTFVL